MFDYIWRELSAPATLSPLLLTAKVCGWVLILHLVLGVALAWYFAEARGRLKSALEILISLPLIFPPIATGFLLLLVLGKRGLLGGFIFDATGISIVFTQKALIIAAFVAGLPLVVKPVQSAIQSLGRDIIEVSYTLGKSRLHTVLFVVLPNVRRSIIAGLALGVGRSLGEVGITLMIGGNFIGRTNTLSLEVFNAVNDGNYARAGVLCGVLLAVSLVIFYALRKVEKRGGA